VLFSKKIFIQQIAVKKVYKFVNHKLSSMEPHFHIVLSVENEILILAVCTSQFEKRKKFIEKKSLPENTLVKISGDFFDKETFVDCNMNIFSEETCEKLYNLYKDGLLEFSGEITDCEYIQILDGIIDSPLIDSSIINKVALLKNKFMNAP
jgi:hypothetical protein